MVAGLDDISCIHLLTCFDVNHTLACICIFARNVAHVSITLCNENNTKTGIMVTNTAIIIFS
jgi:hypothetical protein